MSLCYRVTSCLVPGSGDVTLSPPIVAMPSRSLLTVFTFCRLYSRCSAQSVCLLLFNRDFHKHRIHCAQLFLSLSKNPFMSGASDELTVGFLAGSCALSPAVLCLHLLFSDSCLVLGSWRSTIDRSVTV